MSGDGASDGKILKVDAAQADRLHRFAHDLKNRLNGLGTSLRMLDELPAGAERDEVRDYAERTYFKALHDLENVLDDLGVERGPTAARREPVDLAALARSVAEELAFRITRKQQQVVFELPEALPVEGDPELLKQVVNTLLSNASKFSATGTTITVRAAERDGHAGLVVSDAGVGLAPEDLPQVFKAYAWLSSRSTAGEEQGRGSLARAFRAMRAHGGSLSVESAGPGLGCSFSLLLPRT
jgi:signal transduction histidine kinase